MAAPKKSSGNKNSVKTQKQAEASIESAFQKQTEAMDKNSSQYKAIEAHHEKTLGQLDSIFQKIKLTNGLTTEQRTAAKKATAQYVEHKKLQADLAQQVKDRVISEEHANKILNKSRASFDGMVRSAKLTSKESAGLLKELKGMSREMELSAEAFDKTAKKAQLLNAAIDQVGSSGIPLMQEFGGVLKNVIEKNAQGARMAMTALGAAAAILFDKYKNADAYAATKADLDRQKNNIGAEIDLAKLDNKRGFVKQKRDVQIAELNINTANEVAKIDNKAGFIKENIAMSVGQNSIDTANTVNQLTIEAAHSSQRAAIQFSATMKSGAAEFQAAGKTALYGKGIGSIGYGAAQMQLAGVGAENVAASLTTATKTLGTKVSSNFAADMSLLEKRTGQSSDNVSGMVSFFGRMGKLTNESALNMVEGMRAMADSAGIDLGGYMEEVAQASKEALGYQIKSGPALQKQVAYAQQLGVSFGDIAKAGKSMVLNYKDSIKKEMELSAMLGRNVNLSEARALFSQGKTDEALKSIKAQGLDPKAMNMFQQEALSQALGGLDLDSLQKIATGSAKDVSAQTGNVKEGNKGFLKTTQAAQSTLAAQQASISAQTAIIDAKLSGKITEAYLKSDGYTQYQKNLLEQQKKQAELDANTEKAFLNSDAYLKYQNDLITIEQRNIKLANDETNAYIMSKKGIELAAKNARFDMERMYDENKRAALVGIGGAVVGNVLGKGLEMGMNKLFGKSNPMPVTIVGAGPLDNILKDKKTPSKTPSKSTTTSSTKSATKPAAKSATKQAEKQAIKQTEKQVAKQTAKQLAKQGGKTAAKALGKSLLKKIPFVGLAASLLFAGQRAMAGDFAGAGLEVASGGASMLPGIGTGASVAIDAALAARDMGAFDSKNPQASVKNGKVVPKTVVSKPVTPPAKPGQVLSDVQYQTRLQMKMVELLGVSAALLQNIATDGGKDKSINLNGVRLNQSLMKNLRTQMAVGRRETVGAPTGM
jgi:hypothetical protein